MGALVLDITIAVAIEGNHINWNVVARYIDFLVYVSSNEVAKGGS